MPSLTAVRYYLSLKKDLSVCTVSPVHCSGRLQIVPKENDVMFSCLSPFALMNWMLFSEIYLRVEYCQGKRNACI